MLDIRFIKDNVEVVKEAVRKKHLGFNVDELMKVEGERVRLLQAVEGMRAEQNVAGEAVARATSHEDKIKALAGLKELKEKLQKVEKELAEVMKKWQTLMLQVPNVPDVSVPEGKDESENQEVKIWAPTGQIAGKNNFDFAPKDHVELLTALGMVDFERGTKVHGFRGYFLTGAGAELNWAVWNYAREFYGKRNFMPIITPAIVKKQYFYGTGHLPREAEDLYKTQDDNYLSGTAEVPMMAYHADEVLAEAELPKRYLAFSPCYRREAGSHGKDVKGLIRVHEFFKLEQLIICKADHAESVKLHEEINTNYEEFLESLGLSYRRLLICGGDLSPSKVKQYDTEIWMPSQNAYREGSSASYYHDFQCRRFNIRYRASDAPPTGVGAGKLRFAHSLNCTAAATPSRIVAAIIENYQQADGSVKVPAVLQPHFGRAAIISPHGSHSSRITPTQ